MKNGWGFIWKRMDEDVWDETLMVFIRYAHHVRLRPNVSVVFRTARPLLTTSHPIMKTDSVLH
ncbi:uncharacterized protein J3R85_003756 [Psidium guajava]|nr:uncharacterized protein J3R85_003756 [Psidium guajava]